MLKDVTFGQYYPVNSVVHRMDSRIKILLVIAYIVLVFFVKTYFGFAIAGALLLFAVILSRVPILSVLRSIKAILFIIIITFIINIFSSTGESDRILVHFWGLSISVESIVFACFMAMRLLFLVMGSCVLTLTTTPIELTDGLESLLKPLTWLRFPTHELALIMSIALRFIPSIMEETERIISAQKARGADFDSGGIIKKAKALLPILIPLIFSAFRRAEELGDALDARCYSQSKKRTKYKKYTIHFRDIVAVFITAVMFVAVIVCNHYFVNVI